MYVYGSVPLDAVTLASPLHTPQLVFVRAVIDKETPEPPVIVIVVLPWQPLLSVTVALYVPAHNPVAVELVWFILSSQMYVYGLVPLDTKQVPVPLQTVPHDAFVEEDVNAIAAGLLIVALLVEKHPTASVTVTL
jgi:hypothetical protein